MKKFLLLIAFSCSLGFSQAPVVEPTIDPALQVAFDQLVERGAAHGVDYPAKLQSAGLVSLTVVDSLPNGDLGSYSRFGSTFKVTVTRELLGDPKALQWTLAHELGHGLDLEHTDLKLPDGTYPWSAEIMSGNGILDKRHLIYQIRVHHYYGRDIWKNYFDQL